MEALFQVVYEDNETLTLRDRVLLEVLYGTGIRVSECAGILLPDLDTSYQAILIRGKGIKNAMCRSGLMQKMRLQIICQNVSILCLAIKSRMMLYL